MSHTVAIWNAKVGRLRGPRVARHIARYSAKYGIDVWLLQEVDGFRRHLAGIRGFKVWQPRGRKLAGNCAILVRDGLTATDPRARFMVRTWPRPRMPGTHPARVDALWTVEGVQYESIHIVSRKGRPRGRAQRWAAGREHAERLVADALNGGPRIVRGGDWNEHASEPDAHFPAWIADRSDMQIVRTGRIEYAMARGVRTSRPVVDHDKAGSDHPIIRLTVTADVPAPPPPPDPEPPMMLTDLADACRSSGLLVVEVPGWQSKGRPGPFAPQGILAHHTGGDSDGFGYAVWLANVGRPDLPAPLCQVALGRNGTVYVCAAGRSNHAGRARASGPMPAGDGNTLYIGIEAMNNGSEGFSRTQYEAYVTLCAALCRWYGWPASRVRGHRETSVTGKVDPGRIDLDRFRRDIDAQMQEDDMPSLEEIEALLDRKLDEKLAGIGNVILPDPKKDSGRMPRKLGWLLHRAAEAAE